MRQLTVTEKVLIKNSIRYFQPLIDSDHRDSLWYSGDVLSFTFEGFTLTLRANGDVIANLCKDNNTSVFVKDKSCHGIFYEKMKDYIHSDKMLHEYTSNQTENLPFLTLDDTNWWEVFINFNRQEIRSVVLDSTNYDEAITEILDNLPALIEDNTQHVFVYHEYDDSQAYGTQILKVFEDAKTGIACLHNRVENHFGKSWNEIATTINDDDTFTETYVSINTGNGCVFFILDYQNIYH